MKLRQLFLVVYVEKSGAKLLFLQYCHITTNHGQKMKKVLICYEDGTASVYCWADMHFSIEEVVLKRLSLKRWVQYPCTINLDKIMSEAIDAVSLRKYSEILRNQGSFSVEANHELIDISFNKALLYSRSKILIPKLFSGDIEQDLILAPSNFVLMRFIENQKQ